MSESSSKFDTNFSRILKTNNIISTELDIDNINIKNNQINNLKLPLFDDEIANKEYVDNIVNNPNGPENSI
jgi:hypothetical protein